MYGNIVIVSQCIESRIFIVFILQKYLIKPYLPKPFSCETFYVTTFSWLNSVAFYSLKPNIAVGKSWDNLGLLSIFSLL